jgi:spore cortex formation protein SpoVR/YcgB (stage V sporulation)
MIQIEGALSMIEEQKMMLENTTAMKDVLSAIKQGNQALKSASKGMSVEDLECMEDNMESINPDREELNEFFKDYAGDDNDDYINEKLEELENICAGKEQTAPKKEKEEEVDDLMQFLCCDSEPIKNNKLKKVEIKEKIK